MKVEDAYTGVVSPTSELNIKSQMNQKTSIETNDGGNYGKKAHYSQISNNSKIVGENKAITRAEEDSILRGGKSSSNS